jgi:hypothetical protein
MSGRRREKGIVILLVAVMLLFVVGAMAALAIDVVTLYTARSQAQLAADGAALAGARVLANSGLTSTAAGPAAAEDLARMIATQVAAHNEVGGRTLKPSLAAGEITVSFDDGDETFATNPHVTVKTERTDLPTFFARIWGDKALTVSATATAEAYNPSGMNALAVTVIPVAPTCVKPWLLPNIDPTQTPAAGAIFNSATGAITATGLVGQSWPNTNPTNPNPSGLSALCGGGTDCGVMSPAVPGRYYPGAIDATDFPVPVQPLRSCATGFNPYQRAIAGCVSRPIPCGATPLIGIDANTYVPNPTDRNTDTAAAVSCLIHYNGAAADPDSIDTAAPTPPFQFLAGNQNPVVGARGSDVLVSDSVATIPVIDVTTGGTPTSPIAVVGFLQVFLGPPVTTSTPAYIPATIINMVGCGTGASGQPILGNGASPVPVRLLSP